MSGSAAASVIFDRDSVGCTPVLCWYRSVSESRPKWAAGTHLFGFAFCVCVFGGRRRTAAAGRGFARGPFWFAGLLSGPCTVHGRLFGICGFGWWAPAGTSCLLMSKKIVTPLRHFPRIREQDGATHWTLLKDSENRRMVIRRLKEMPETRT